MTRDLRKNLRWRNASQEEYAADVRGKREINDIDVFSLCILNDDERGNPFSEVVHRQASKDFKEGTLHLFCMKSLKAKRVFEIAKRGLNAPTAGIERFQRGRREIVGIEIGDNSLEGVI